MSILDKFSLQGKTALITGAAGLYGRQIATAVAEAGATCFIASRSLPSLHAVADELCERDLDVTALSYDQGDEKSILALRDELKNRVGGIDILVNNSVLRPMKKGFDDDAAAFARSMEVNATGLFVISRAFGDLMAERGGGSILNIGSIYGLIAPDPTIYQGTDINGWLPDYFFHKGGWINLTRYFASIYGKDGIRVNCLSPGGCYTNQDANFVERYSDKTMLGRMANPEDLGGPVAFLLSDASAYITGVNLPVDAGYTAK